MEFESFAQTATRPQIVQYLAEQKLKLSESEYQECETRVWRVWARRQRPSRVVALLLALIEHAQKGKRSSYKEVEKISGTEAFRENMHLIKSLGLICREMHWPPYAVLIKRESGEVGPGFFKDYGVGGSPASLSELERGFEGLCFNSEAPSMSEVATAVDEHFKK